MNKKLLIVLAIIVVIVAILAFGHKKDNDYRIGVIIPQTGFGAYWGDPVLKGIKLAESDLSQIYPDVKFSIKVEDSQSSPVSAVNAAKKLLSADQVDALYTEFSGVSSAVSPVAKEAGKIFAYSTFNQKIGELNDTAIKTFVNFEIACDELGGLMNKDGRVLILSTVGDTAPYCVRGLEKHLDKKNIKLFDSITGNDFRSLLLQNKTFNPDYTVIISYEDDSYNIIKQAKELGLSTKFFCYGQDCLTEKIIKELPKSYTEGSIAYQVGLNDIFVNKIKALYPDISTGDLQGAANAYQSMMFLAQGMVGCSRENLTNCTIDNLANKKDLKYSAYQNAYFENKVLASDLQLLKVQDGKLVLIK